MKVLISTNNLLKGLTRLDFIGFSLLRMYLFFIFWNAGTYHLEDFQKFSSYIVSLEVFLPIPLSYIIIATEIGGAACLLSGLFTRWATLPLIVLMSFSVYFVHWENGWSQANNGIETPLTYILMLMVLTFSGGGKYFSLDYWVSK